jgi:hypothetical protein
MRKVLNVVTLAGALLAAPATALAFPACDSFGQDWNINLGAFGGTFPGSAVTTGCRDCNASLGCGGALPLDGVVVYTIGPTLVWSMTAYRPGSGSCVSTHWNGSNRPGTTGVTGQVSNEFGPFGPFTLTLGSSCRATEGGADPSR